MSVMSVSGALGTSVQGKLRTSLISALKDMEGPDGFKIGDSR
jgi:hypothetical protein